MDTPSLPSHVQLQIKKSKLTMDSWNDTHLFFVCIEGVSAQRLNYHILPDFATWGHQWFEIRELFAETLTARLGVLR